MPFAPATRAPCFHRGRSMTTDVGAFVGTYPYRFIQPATPEWLIGEMDRLGIERAWAADLPAFLYKDPRESNRWLAETLAPFHQRIMPVPTLHPGLPDWSHDLSDAASMGAPAVRVYPQYQGLDPVGGEMRVIVAAAASAGLPVMLTVRFEDVRQRHPLDVAPDFPASAVRQLVRSDPEAKLLVMHGERSFVEEVHFGLTPEEARRIVWDISWIWGPPEDHLALLLETVGADRFVLGTGMPLRIPDAALTKVELLPTDDGIRKAIRGDNLARFLAT